MVPGVIDDVLRRAARRLVPLALTIEVTHRCNLSCAHCYAEAGAGRRASLSGRRELTESRAGGTELTGVEWEDLLEQAARLGSLYLTVTGGEPLLYGDLERVLWAARRLRYAVRVLTNATLVDERWAGIMAALPVTGVEFSLYGPRADVHDEVTGSRGSFEATAAGVARLVSRGVRVLAKMPVMSANVESVSQTFELARAWGVGLRVDPMITPTSSGDLGPCGLRISPVQFRGLLAELVARGFSTEQVIRGRDDAWCAAGRIQAAIGPTGLLMPCVGFPRAVADLKVRPLAEAWTSGPLLDELRASRIGDSARCGGCGLVGYCRRCPGVAVLEGRTASDAVPYACMIALECSQAGQER